jgi:hypothetical protein
MIAVRIQDEVVDYLRRLAPQPRHTLRLAIKDLAHEKGDIKALKDFIGCGSARTGLFSNTRSSRVAA